MLRLLDNDWAIVLRLIAGFVIGLCLNIYQISSLCSFIDKEFKRFERNSPLD